MSDFASGFSNAFNAVTNARNSASERAARDQAMQQATIDNQFKNAAATSAVAQYGPQGAAPEARSINQTTNLTADAAHRQQALGTISALEEAEKSIPADATPEEAAQARSQIFDQAAPMFQQLGVDTSHMPAFRAAYVDQGSAGPLLSAAKAQLTDPTQNQVSGAMTPVVNADGTTTLYSRTKDGKLVGQQVQGQTNGVAVANINAGARVDAAAKPKVSAGYSAQKQADGTWRAVPITDDPAVVAAAEKQNAKQSAIEGVAARLNNTLDAVKKARKFLAASADIPLQREAAKGTAGFAEFNYQKQIDKLNSGLSLADLQLLKAAGVSFGKTTNIEFLKSGDAAAALDIGQDKKELLDQLDQATTFLEATRPAAQKAISTGLVGGGDIPAPAATKAPAAGLSPNAAALKAKLGL